MADVKLCAKTSIQETVCVPVRKKYDVIVAGGGTAGVLAAVAAARRGAQVALIECNALLGGDLLGGGISWLSYFNVFKQFNVEPKQLVFGLAYELIERLEAAGDSPGFYDDKGPETQESRGTHGDREGLRRMLFQMTKESGVAIYLDTLVCGVMKDGIRINGLILQSSAQRFALQAQVVIDCTGDGDVAHLAGANCHEFPNHGVGMAFGVSNVDFEKAFAFGRAHKALVHDCTGTKGRYAGKPVKFTLRTGKIPALKEGVRWSGIHSGFGTTIARDGEASYINGVNIAGGGNGLDSEKATHTIVTLRDNIKKSVRFLREEIPGFENAHLSWTTPVVGTRRARYVECEYDISAQHVAQGVIPEDSIGIFGSQDAHYLGHVIEGGKWYGIPYRALVPKFVENLLVAGRMISSDWIAHMSTRLIVSCFLQGQAAGTAAAMAARNGCTVRELDVKQLRNALREDGVYLGEDA